MIKRMTHLNITQIEVGRRQHRRKLADEGLCRRHTAPLDVDQFLPYMLYDLRYLDGRQLPLALVTAPGGSGIQRGDTPHQTRAAVRTPQRTEVRAALGRVRAPSARAVEILGLSEEVAPVVCTPERISVAGRDVGALWDQGARVEDQGEVVLEGPGGVGGAVVLEERGSWVQPDGALLRAFEAVNVEHTADLVDLLGRHVHAQVVQKLEGMIVDLGVPAADLALLLVRLELVQLAPGVSAPQRQTAQHRHSLVVRVRAHRDIHLQSPAGAARRLTLGLVAGGCGALLRAHRVSALTAVCAALQRPQTAQAERVRELLRADDERHVPEDQLARFDVADGDQVTAELGTLSDLVGHAEGFMLFPVGLLMRFAAVVDCVTAAATGGSRRGTHGALLLRHRHRTDVTHTSLLRPW